MRKGQTRTLIFLSALVLFSLAIYSNTLQNGFVLDDESHIVENPWIRDFGHLKEIFSSNLLKVPGDSNYFRPMMHLIYTFCYSLFGLSAWGYHLVNILWHAGASTLVFFVAREVVSASKAGGESAIPAGMAALIFAAHPVHTEAVSWIAGVMDLSCAFFFLLSLLFYIKSGRAGRPGLALSVFFYFLAMLGKEPAIVLPAVLFAWDRAFAEDKLSVRLKRYLPYIAGAGVYLFMRFYALKGLAPVHHEIKSGMFLFLVDTSVLFGKYIKMVLFPVGLNFFHLYRPVSSAMEPGAMLWLAFVFLFLIIAVYSAARLKSVFVGLSLFIFPLLPALYTPALIQRYENPFAERFLYLPSAGFTVLMALGLAKLLNRYPGRARAAAAVFSIFLILFSIGTYQRNPVWKSNLSLWADVVSKSPESPIAHLSLGEALFFEGRLAEAIGHMETAVSRDPDPDSRNNLGTAYAKAGMMEKAIEQFEAALAQRPEDPLFRANLERARRLKGK